MAEDAAADLTPALRFRLLPNLGFFHAKADEQSKQRRQATQEEQRTPSPTIEKAEIAKRGQQVTERVALLQQARQHAAQAWRNFLHGERSTDSPLAAHPDAEERAQHQKAGEIRRETGGHFHHRIEDQVEHKRQPAPVAVRQQAEEKCAHRTKREGESERESHCLVGLMEFFSDRREAPGNQKEIEGVERPAEKAGGQSGPMIGGTRIRSLGQNQPSAPLDAAFGSQRVSGAPRT